MPARRPARAISEWLGIHAFAGRAEVALNRSHSGFRSVLFGGVTVALIDAAAQSLPGTRSVDSLSVRFLRPVSGVSATASAQTALHQSESGAVAPVEVHDDRGLPAVHALAGLQTVPCGES